MTYNLWYKTEHGHWVISVSTFRSIQAAQKHAETIGARQIRIEPRIALAKAKPVPSTR